MDRLIRHLPAAWLSTVMVLLSAAGVAAIFLLNGFAKPVSELPESTAIFVSAMRVVMGYMILSPVTKQLLAYFKESPVDRAARAYDIKTTALCTIWWAIAAAMCDVVTRDFSGVITAFLDFVAGNPVTVLAVALGMSFGAWVSRQCILPSDSVIEVATKPAAKAAASSQVPVEKDAISLRRTALHEIGHLLAYAIQPVLPEKLRLTVNRAPAANESSGHVSSRMTTQGEPHEYELRWLMLLDLSGLTAEHLFTGIRGLGSVVDMQKYMQSATIYAENGFGGAYFTDPKSDYQRDQNNKVFGELMDENMAILTAFFERNRALVEDVVGEVIKNGELGTKACHKILGRVELTAELKLLRERLKDRFITAPAGRNGAEND